MTREDVLAIRALRGPNTRAAGPVLEVSLRSDHGCADALARLTLDLQAECGARASGAWAVAGDVPGVSVAVIGIEDEEVARRCLDVAIEACRTAETPLDVPDAQRRRLREIAGEILLGPNTRPLADAARRRGIPVRRLGRGSLLQLGHGVRQRRLWGARSSRTSAIGEMIGWDKALAKELLCAVGIPVPDGRLVRDPADAWSAACEIGGPVVVKPARSNHGRSVFIGVTRRAEIERAYRSARAEGGDQDVLVERCVPGAEHRVLVVAGRVVAAMRGEPLHAIGDGGHSLAELIDEINRDPRRGEGPEPPLWPVRLDEITLATLARQGYAPESVPPPGERVLLQRNGNLGRDVTDEVHAANRELCLLAAETVGLDIAGIDLVVEDISSPIREQGGALLEVNPMPGIAMHLDPVGSKSRPVDDAIVGALFPPGADGRIPLAAVHAASAGTAIARRLHERIVASGICAGLTCSDGTFVGRDRTRAEGPATSEVAAALLLHPRVEAAVFELPERAVVEEGLPFDRCRVLVVAAGAGAALTPALRTMLGTVAADGAAFVAESAPWLEEARAVCPGNLVPYREDDDAAVGVAALAAESLAAALGRRGLGSQPDCAREDA